MPLSPREVEKKRTAAKKKNLTALFERIDASLINGRVRFSVPDELDPSFVHDVVSAYELAGWTVTTMGGELDNSGPYVAVTMSAKAESKES